MSFPERLKELRIKKGASREDVALFVGLSWHTIAKWEVGKRDPDTSAVMRLAEYFGVTTDYLLGKVDSPGDVLVYEREITSEDYKRELIGDPTMDEINDNLKLMTPEEREAIRRLTQSIANRQTNNVG